jgi:hypothetical protein
MIFFSHFSIFILPLAFPAVIIAWVQPDNKLAFSGMSIWKEVKPPFLTAKGEPQRAPLMYS